MSHQQLQSYGDMATALKLNRETGGAGDQTQDTWVQDEWLIHNTMAAL